MELLCQLLFKNYFKLQNGLQGQVYFFLIPLIQPNFSWSKNLKKNICHMFFQQIKGKLCFKYPKLRPVSCRILCFFSKNKSRFYIIQVLSWMRMVCHNEWWICIGHHNCPCGFVAILVIQGCQASAGCWWSHHCWSEFIFPDPFI